MLRLWLLPCVQRDLHAQRPVGSNDGHARVMLTSSMPLELPEQIRTALSKYRSDRSPESWTALSQLWVRDNVQVLDALQQLKPDFPEPLAVPVDGAIEDNDELFQWSVLPDPDDVLDAIQSALQHGA